MTKEDDGGNLTKEEETDYAEAGMAYLDRDRSRKMREIY